MKQPTLILDQLTIDSGSYLNEVTKPWFWATSEIISQLSFIFRLGFSWWARSQEIFPQLSLQQIEVDHRQVSYFSICCSIWFRLRWMWQRISVGFVAERIDSLLQTFAFHAGKIFLVCVRHKCELFCSLWIQAKNNDFPQVWSCFLFLSTTALIGLVVFRPLLVSWRPHIKTVNQVKWIRKCGILMCAYHLIFNSAAITSCEGGLINAQIYKIKNFTIWYFGTSSGMSINRFINELA